MSQKKVEINLPIQYTDKVALIGYALELYNTFFFIGLNEEERKERTLTERDKSLLTLCFIFDVNSPDFDKKVIQSGIGIDSKVNVHTAKSRLKKKGHLVEDKYNQRKSHLTKGLQMLRKSIMENDTITYNISFSKP